MAKLDIDFYSSSTEDAFDSYYDELISKGFTEDEAKEFLESIYNTVGGEYGN